ncbi:hypothetical protein DPEC_G00221100 [Dallia pectoralis]|uniref:Uncharacterized protein n=1 Tax=Dallia pectoralis TaxID=75939 RepID=A0ACC2G3S0_DALPE|nr:hypothetical protein DPEC_G00221100 [Dallia pectoralis]
MCRPSIIVSRGGGQIAGARMRPFIMPATTQCRNKPGGCDYMRACDGKQTFNGFRQLSGLLCRRTVIGWSELRGLESRGGGSAAEPGETTTRRVPVMASKAQWVDHPPSRTMPAVCHVLDRFGE